MIAIRPEQPDDIAAVHALNETAFGQPVEATIVDSIRTACSDILSLVAVDDSQIVGHIFFSPVSASGAKGTVYGMGLARALDEPN